LVSHLVSCKSGIYPPLSPVVGVGSPWQCGGGVRVGGGLAGRDVVGVGGPVGAHRREKPHAGTVSGGES